MPTEKTASAIPPRAMFSPVANLIGAVRCEHALNVERLERGLATRVAFLGA